MRTSQDFAAYCAELLGPAGRVQARRMFGGWGLYVEDVFVAIVQEEALYLKTDAQTQPRFEAAGGRQFVYTRQGKQQGLGFWTGPDEAMDSAQAMRPWAALALDAAVRARQPKPGKR